MEILKSIRLSRTVDLDNLFLFGQKNFKYFWRKEQLAKYLVDPNSKYFFAYLDEEIIGYVLFNFSPITKEAHLYQICVKEKYRQNGLAKLLIQKALSDLNVLSIFLEVAVNNHKAISFYGKLGFEELNKVKSFYSDGMDAFAMRCHLSKLAKLLIN